MNFLIIEEDKMINKEKIEMLDKLVDFIENKYVVANDFHYSDGGNQYRQGYKDCLYEILNFVGLNY